MSAGFTETQSVRVDVLPPLPKGDFRQEPPPLEGHAVPFDGLRTFYHPASGVVILGLDWFAFGTDALTGFLALPIVCVMAFCASFVALLAIQTKWSKDSSPVAFGKAFMGAVMVGLPFPITGTLLGAAILALSGLPHHPVDAVRKIAARGFAK